jgi:hypothetical protein
MPADERTFPQHSIGIAGPGRVAQALGRPLDERGEPVLAVAGRDPQRAEEAPLAGLARCGRWPWGRLKP